MPERTSLQLVAGRKQSGQLVHEEVLVEKLSPTKFRIIASPGYVLGVAAGDVIEPVGGVGEFRVVERGGNVSIQIFGDNGLVDDHLGELAGLSQAVDARGQDLTVLTVPLRLGFAHIENVLNAFCQRHPDVRWYYANVYDPSDGVTPLNWWLKHKPGHP